MSNLLTFGEPYWSSTECDEDTAYCQMGTAPGKYPIEKNRRLRVRLVRDR